MASNNSFYAPAPTVLLPPNDPNQYFASSHYVDQTSHSTACTSTSANGFADIDMTSPNNTLVETPGSLAGRKRSRGDIHAPDDEDDHLRGGLAESNASENASSIQLQERKPFDLAHTKRPSVASRKSQRVDSTTPAQDDLAQLVLPAEMRAVTTEPLIDEATRVLGISWARMDSSEARQISQAAYTKWIQNHYPGLREVAVWFEYGNEEVPAYLVKALNVYRSQHEYYIFSHDLTEARLVTTDASQLVPRLQMMPAVHLAAPGGCIKADVDLNNAAQNEAKIIQAQIAEKEPASICSAHAMEMD